MGLSQLKAAYDAIPAEKKAPAIAMLKAKLVDQSEIKAAIAEDPEGWFAPYHFYWGMAVRNLLRTEGYGEDYWPVGNLDDIYVELVEDAVLRS